MRNETDCYGFRQIITKTINSVIIPFIDRSVKFKTALRSRLVRDSQFLAAWLQGADHEMGVDVRFNYHVVELGENGSGPHTKVWQDPLKRIVKQIPSSTLAVATELADGDCRARQPDSGPGLERVRSVRRSEPVWAPAIEIRHRDQGGSASRHPAPDRPESDLGQSGCGPGLGDLVAALGSVRWYQLG